MASPALSPQHVSPPQLGGDFCTAVDAALAAGSPSDIPDETLRRVMTAAARIYAAKADTGGDDKLAVIEDGLLTATEAVVTVCAFMRAANLNPFDVAMWYRRSLPEFPAR